LYQSIPSSAESSCRPPISRVRSSANSAHERLLIKAMACVASLVTGPAFALTFKSGEIEAFIDTTVTASAAMRTQGADTRSFIPGVSAPYSGNTQAFPDGGDIYSSPLSLLADMGVKKDNYGLFSRMSYTYDYTIMHKDCDNCFRPTPVGQLDGISNAGQNAAGNKFRVLDLFGHASWNPGGHLLNVRIGKQVVNWGESDILGGGISQMQNPVDFGKTTTPGTEIKETLMPQEMIYAQFGVTDAVTVEGYYVWHWRRSEFFSTGTFFSPLDLYGKGYKPDLLIPGIPYTGTDRPDDGGQWGMAVHTILSGLDNADLGFYWVRSHAFMPAPTVDESHNVPDPYSLLPVTLGGYRWKFAQDLDTFAVSLNGVVPGSLGLAFQTEVNYRPDFHDVRQCGNLFGLGGIQTAFGMLPPGLAGPDGNINGCGTETSDLWTYIGALTYSDATTLLGANTLSVILNVNAQWIDDLEGGDPTDFVHNGSGPAFQGHFKGTDGLDQPVTPFSWGYALVGQLEYNDIFANLDMRPTLVWIHGVDGYQPQAAGIGGALQEGQQIARASVDFSYLSSTSLELAYTQWLGDNAAGAYFDRDNLSLAFKYRF
jgi:hypothetical protein